MKRALLIGSTVLALAAGDGAAAAPSVAGRTFNLVGKFGGSANVTCRVGGTHGAPLKARKKLGATITFNEDGTFQWSNDALQVGPIGTGDWSQQGSRIELDFDNPSSMSYLQMFGFQQINVQSGGASASGNFSPAKYDFFAKINGKGDKLVVTEKGGFRFKANASAYGGANSCNYVVNLNRTYNGKRVQ
jgi:hypothetical protein